MKTTDKAKRQYFLSLSAKLRLDVDASGYETTLNAEDPVVSVDLVDNAMADIDLISASGELGDLAAMIFRE